MDLDGYAEWALQELLWFRERLLREGVEKLWRSCRLAGESGYAEVRQTHGSAIRQYVLTPPDEREPLVRQIADERTRHLFLIAATDSVRNGATLLELASANGLSADYNPSRAFLLMQAAQTFEQVRETDQSPWPFDDHPDPFD